MKTSSFGLGREKVALNGIIPQKMYRGEAPGPGMYPYNNCKSTIAFSFRKKLAPHLTTDMFSPAPNKYQIPESINAEGKYFSSKYASSKAPGLKQSELRFKSEHPNRKTPAPGSYPTVDLMNTTGVYKLTKFRNSMCRSFSKADRNTMGMDMKKKGSIPGPGNYRLPSEFGYYVSSGRNAMSMTTSLPN